MRITKFTLTCENYDIYTKIYENDKIYKNYDIHANL